ncbi:polysaccharide deacetylase family protein [Streptomyces stramineus]
MNRARSSAFRLGRGLLAAALALGAMAPADREHPGARTAPAAVRAPAGPVDRLFGQEVRRIPTSRRVVALTFNAAWDDGGVAEVLTVLRERRAPATFFPTGDFAERHPARCGRWRPGTASATTPTATRSSTASPRTGRGGGHPRGPGHPRGGGSRSAALLPLPLQRHHPGGDRAGQRPGLRGHRVHHRHQRLPRPRRMA